MAVLTAGLQRRRLLAVAMAGFSIANNMKAAKTLGLELPASLLARADDVIE